MSACHASHMWHTFSMNFHTCHLLTLIIKSVFCCCRSHDHVHHAWMYFRFISTWIPFHLIYWLCKRTSWLFFWVRSRHRVNMSRLWSTTDWSIFSNAHWMVTIEWRNPAKPRRRSIHLWWAIATTFSLSIRCLSQSNDLNPLNAIAKVLRSRLFYCLFTIPRYRALSYA